MKKKILFITLYVLFHIFVLREVRTFLFSLQLNDTLIEHVEESPYLRFHALDTRLVYFEYESPDFHKYWHYKVPFGSFFLIGVVGLLAAGARPSFFISLIGVHAIVTVITGIIFLFDVSTHYWLLVILDLLSRYLIPLCSIGIIPLAVNSKQLAVSS